MGNAATELVLSCRSWQQAQNIIEHLFSKQLIARAEILPIQKSIEEVKVIMENIELDILAITREVAELFGTNDFMLEALPR
ncbi:MAG: hypothetical protein JWP13_412 [Candidatus Saccharibacteria bacterium]|nr:hypothetical protein [Candidatus Saccharibacteria bacterium]